MTYEDRLKGAWMMAERNYKKCFRYKNFKEVASHSGYTDINYTENQRKNFICTYW